MISGSPEKPLNLTLGRLFQNFAHIESISITYASIPAIGDSSFWPGVKLKHLDLRYNRITSLKNSEFNGLPVLEELNLSHNDISSVVSASLASLGNLVKLSLAHNKLKHLVPRMFLQLSRLQHLDLSFNPLSELNAQDLKDTTSLRSLSLAGCNLFIVHSLVYQRLPHLEVRAIPHCEEKKRLQTCYLKHAMNAQSFFLPLLLLLLLISFLRFSLSFSLTVRLRLLLTQVLDLSDNQLNNVAPDEFRSLNSLRVLNLNGNRLTIIHDLTFNGLKLDSLGVSRNHIEKLGACSFCNSTVIRLDISRNKIKEFTSDMFKPLEVSLFTLNVEENSQLINPTRSVFYMLRPLSNLRILSLASMNLDDTLPGETFTSQATSLTSLDLSRNKFANISIKWFINCISLEQLDLSHNQIIQLTSNFIKKIDSIKTLKHIWLQDNPWSCFRCHVLPLLDWINSKPPVYTSVCRSDKDNFCIRCHSPSELAFANLHSINEIQLEWCSDPTVQLRVTASEPRVGLVLAILIILTFIAIIVTIVILYRKKQSASYYTHEDELRSDRMSIFTIERLMSQDPFGHLIPRKSFANHSVTPVSPERSPRPRPCSIPFSPAQDTISPASLSPPMSPRNAIQQPKMSPSRSLSQSLSSIPPPPPLPPPDLPSSGETSLKKPLTSPYSSSHTTKPKQPL